MSWRVARSLLVLFDQLNAAAPGRSRSSDGTVGDLAHQAGVSHSSGGAASDAAACHVRDLRVIAPHVQHLNGYV